MFCVSGCLARRIRLCQGKPLIAQHATRGFKQCACNPRASLVASDHTARDLTKTVSIGIRFGCERGHQGSSGCIAPSAALPVAIGEQALHATAGDAFTGGRTILVGRSSTPGDLRVVDVEKLAVARSPLRVVRESLALE